MSFTRTFSTELDPNFGEPFQILVTIPSQKPSQTERNKVPITIFISKEGPNTQFGCYIYSIVHVRSKSLESLGSFLY